MCASFSSISAAFSGERGESSCTFHVIQTVGAGLHTQGCTRQVVPLASSTPPPRTPLCCCAFIFRTLAHRQTDHMLQSCSLYSGTTESGRVFSRGGGRGETRGFRWQQLAVPPRQPNAASCRWEVTAPAADLPLTPSAPPWPPQQSHHM